jgi:hypothetical protein
MRRLAFVPLLGFGLLAACAWPPNLASAPAVPDPVQTAGQATDQATSALDQVPAALPNVSAPRAPAVPRVSVPPVSVPRMGGGLLRR